ncbi:hypothetical protein [Lacibacter sediminis]|uniref:Uncharacterized protein n=1 Tax=Lacibacter sediminis TaxID=2760713 RepID=A0A7G5XKY3_9BACT|nr:hypothetical protein [Lacibacter sediminis]QNA46136.1 hypothetical protein H4075_08135 [Lacibacter sediminis]
MQSPFTIDKYYSTDLSKSQVFEEMNNLDTEQQFGGLRTDKFIAQTSESGFIVIRNTYGLDGFTLEQYPTLEGYYISEKPLTINIVVKPRYFTILFFSIFVFTFIPASIFIDKMTINGIFRSPTIPERFLFAGVGGVIPGLWCYFGYIRPIKKAENWIVEKLRLSVIPGYGS